MQEPPERAVVFRQTMRVEQADIDALGHASNVAYIRWVQDVAAAASVDVGWDYERYVGLGSAFMVRRHEVDYLRPVLAGDELELSTWVGGWRAATSHRHTMIRKGDQVIARAVTTWALVSLDSGRPSRIPPEIRDAFSPPAAAGEAEQ